MQEVIVAESMVARDNVRAIDHHCRFKLALCQLLILTRLEALDGDPFASLPVLSNIHIAIRAFANMVLEAVLVHAKEPIGVFAL
jgi:hypothetical protein